ncbi:hypothetical protein O181_028707 [Austropuccinia psidii MF-1]|uniref:Uncharacterized protein n=1 Tax=Austropuccinia psidii MF-1 TaxID=1389203 RepID=A0A9Q3CSF9_9BASI|nr:hypothetical protein [Austropuccinia psidii MF-1]
MSTSRGSTFQHQNVYMEKEGWAFGKEFPVSEAPTPDGTSEVPISRIKNQGVVKRIGEISNSPTNPNAEGSDELDDEEVEVVNPSIGHHSSTSPYQPSSKIFQSKVIPSTPRNFQPTLSIIPSSIPPPSPNTSTSRPFLASPLSSSPIPKPRQLPIVPPKNNNLWPAPEE